MQVEPPKRLRTAVEVRLRALEFRRARVRTALFGALSLAFMATLVPVAQYTVQQFYASGFMSYLSLFFSDQGLVLAYWSEFALSLAESLPSIALLLLLPLTAALVWALRSAWRSAPAAFSMRSA